MKKLIKHIIVFTFLLGVISSCTIAKRQYSSGYYFDWNNRNHRASAESAEKSIPSQQWESAGPLVAESDFTDTLTTAASPQTTTLLQDTVEPPAADSTPITIDYVRAEENKIQMEQTATELTKSANRNLLAFFATVFGGIIAGTLLSGGVLVILGIALLALLVLAFISNIHLIRKIEAFEKRYAEFSNEVKFKTLHKISGFNHFILALCVLGVLLTLIAALVLVLAIAAMV